MKKKTILFIIAILAGIISCNDDRTSSGYAVYFVCDMAYYPFNQISSFGQFITVKRKSSKSYETTDANGNSTTKNLTEIELRNQYNYGLGGLIIGTPSMCDGNIWVYDWACPTCDLPKYRLNIAHDATGYATCPNCGNVYDLNSGGIPIKVPKGNDARPLWRYNYFTNGTTIVIKN